MPELPEVETMRRGIRSVIGSQIEELKIPRCRLKPISITPRPATMRRHIVGRTISDIGRVGKRVLVHLADADVEDEGAVLVFEPRMTGLLLITDPPNETHLRFGLQLSGGDVDWLWFWDRRGLGTVRLLDRASREEQLGPKKLGPDALEMTAELYRERLGKSRRAIKVALLDQKAVAGIGNLYASEILHLAKIHPEKTCDQIRRPKWAALQQAADTVLKKAIKYEGSTLGDGTYRNALNEDGGYQNHHRVYSRAGETCATCERGKIQRIVQAQRSTFFCPKCQRKPPPSSK